MVTGDYIKIKDLNTDELIGVVNMYPWFGTARKELCIRFSQIGGRNLSETDYAKCAMYLGSRRIISDIVRAAKNEDYSDKNLSDILNSLASGENIKAEDTSNKSKPRVAGGDYFSQNEYDSVKGENENIFSSFAKEVKGSEIQEKSDGTILDDFCTETLAQIYMEQCHFEQAKYIYSKLILRYPEKSAYFASLIEKLAQLTDN